MYHEATLRRIAAITTMTVLNGNSEPDDMAENLDEVHNAFGEIQSLVASSLDGRRLPPPVALSSSQLATILAALRFYQEKGMGDPANRSESIHTIATDGGTEISLDSDEIDELTAFLNSPAFLLFPAPVPQHLHDQLSALLEDPARSANAETIFTLTADLLQALATAPPPVDRAAIIEECAVTAETQQRGTAYQWVQKSLFGNLTSHIAARIRSLKNPTAPPPTA